jgi:MoaA/NifB/PqqE/SkfB family radical SAM enzyme
MKFNLGKDHILKCTAGYNYFHIRVDGRMNRCCKRSDESIGYIQDFSRETIKNINPVCNIKECDISCDYEWACKYIYLNNEVVKTVPSGEMRSLWGDVELEKPEHKGVHVISYITMKCPYFCYYCSLNCKPDLRKEGDLDDEIWLDFFDKIIEIYPSGSIDLCGGEPFVREDLLIEIYKKIIRSDKNFRFMVSTNLSLPILKFVNSLSDASRVLINASIHPTDKKFNFDIFLGRLLLLKETGATVQTSLVAYPEQVYLYDYYKKILNDYDIHIGFPQWGGGDIFGNEARHTEKQIEYINKRTRYKIGKEIKVKEEKTEQHKLLKEEETKVGSFYYLWYGENNWGEYVRKYLHPPMGSAMGEYSSSDKEVLDQHCLKAKENGIDFFSVSWCREGGHISFLNWDILTENKPLPHGMKFHLFYETGHIRQHEKFEDLLVEEVEYLCRYFDHESYLKIDGRPVLMFYITRDMVGYEETFEKIREVCREKGYEVLLFGDEVWWDRNHPDYLNADKIKLFDAVLAYNMYIDHEDKPLDFLERIFEEYDKYYELCQENEVEFIPVAFPRFNDRGVRLNEDKKPIQDNGEFFTEFLKGIRKYKNKFNMSLITSWNEWYDDTQIESAYVLEDKGEEPNLEITGGVLHHEYREEPLKAIKELLK